MARAHSSSLSAGLTALDSVMTLDVDDDKSGCFSLQYISGAGTLIVQGSCDGGTSWETMCFIKSTDTTRAYVASAAAAGLYEGTFGGINKIRVKKSVGSAACVAVLAITEY